MKRSLHYSGEYDVLLPASRGALFSPSCDGKLLLQDGNLQRILGPFLRNLLASA